MLKLYDLERSGNCYRVRLMVSLLGLAHEKIKVDLPTGEQKRPEFLALNPLGQIPLIDDDGIIIRDSIAILVYLAGRYGGGRWYPQEPIAQAQVQQWFALVASDIYQGLVGARAIKLGIRQGDHATAVGLGLRALTVLDRQLAKADWLVGGSPSIADIAAYPYVALAPVGDIDLAGTPSVVAWCKRIEALAGYLPLPQVPAKS